MIDLDVQGLSYSMEDLVPWPVVEPGSPTLGARCLSHWTTKDSLGYILYEESTL